MSGTHESVDLVDAATTKRLSVAAVLAALTAALAYVSIPVPGLPAPVSFQMLGVYFAGLLLGPRWGGFSVGLYLLAGLAGAPVFSNGGAGVAYALGPKGGYLLGFLLAAVLIGVIVHRGTEVRSLREVSTAVQAGALLAGLAVIYAVGVPWLSYAAGYGLIEAATVGAAVFLPGDAIKIAATLALVRGGEIAAEQAAIAE